jgi:hypothetical protein
VVVKRREAARLPVVHSALRTPSLAICDCTTVRMPERLKDGSSDCLLCFGGARFEQAQLWLAAVAASIQTPKT